MSIISSFVRNVLFRIPSVRTAPCRRAAFAGAVFLMSGMGAAGAPPAFAAKGDCGQPITNGADPSASDALGVLRAALGLIDCALSVCDVDDNGSIVAGDALRVLRYSVGQNVTLNCPSASGGVDIQCSTDSGSLVLKTTAFEEALELTGDFTLECDDPATGGGNCTCVLENIEPMPFLGAGVICVSPSDACTGGTLDCDGGTGRQTNIVADHDIGSCTGNAACEASCNAHCTGAGQVFYQSACEGFCLGGTNADAACTNDSQCPGSVCTGPQHAGTCGCQCERSQGSAAPSGHLQCRVGLSLTYEFAAPCGDGDLFFAVGDACLALSSESATATILDANDVEDATIQATTEIGASQTCGELAATGSEGVSLVGVVPVLDSPIGDLLGIVSFPCD